MSVSERKFGILQTGETVKIFHLENKSGAYAEVTDFGAILVKVCVPDKDGTLTDVVLGYDDLPSYEVNGCLSVQPSAETETASAVRNSLSMAKK